MPLTCTPAHTTHHPDRFEDETTGLGYDVSQDGSPEDPRSWVNPEHSALWVYNEPMLNHSSGTDKPSGNVAIDLFAKFYQEYDAPTALKITRDELALNHSELKLSIDIATLRGYSQSDWMDAVCATAEGYGTPASVMEVYRMWAYGDVWTVIPDDGDSLSGIYASSAEEALKLYREEYEETDSAPAAPVVEKTSPPSALAVPIAKELVDAACLQMLARAEDGAHETITWLHTHAVDERVTRAFLRLFDDLREAADK